MRPVFMDRLSSLLKIYTSREQKTLHNNIARQEIMLDL